MLKKTKGWYAIPLICLSIFFVQAQPQLSFSENLMRYYGDVDWICKDFSEMALPEFVEGWRQLVLVLAHPQMRWFYLCDSLPDYVKYQHQEYASIDRYDRESLDMYWVSECKKYHAFLTEHFFDTHRNVIIKRSKKKASRIKDRYLMLQDALLQMAPQELVNFYIFFFEQIANVMLKKLNYMYESLQVEYKHTMQLLEHKQLLNQIYNICIHKTGRMSTAEGQKMAYHYRRIESVFDMIVNDLLKQLGF